MNQSRRFAALYGTLLATAVPALGDGEPAAISPTWEIHADLSGDGLPGKLRELLLPNASKLGPSPSLTIHGFENAETADKDWMVSLHIPGHADRIWNDLQRDFNEEWGDPDETGRWLVNEPDSGVSFVIVQSGESLKLTNAVENLSVTLATVEAQTTEARAIRGYVNIRASAAEQESKLFQLAESATFSAGSSGDGMVLDVTVALLESPSANRFEQAVREALDSKLLDRLTPFLPKPALTRDSTDEHEVLTFSMEFDAAQTDRIITAVIDHLIEVKIEDPQPAPESNDSDAKNR